ncbi:hypothetical protein ACQPZJ_35550 [Actinoplanes sp. CA-054009]
MADDPLPYRGLGLTSEREVTFLGGVAHGRTELIPDDYRSWRMIRNIQPIKWTRETVSIPEMPVFEFDTYLSRRFRVGNRTIEFFARDDMDERQTDLAAGELLWEAWINRPRKG